MKKALILLLFVVSVCQATDHNLYIINKQTSSDGNCINSFNFKVVLKNFIFSQSKHEIRWSHDNENPEIIKIAHTDFTYINGEHVYTSPRINIEQHKTYKVDLMESKYVIPPPYLPISPYYANFFRKTGTEFNSCMSPDLSIDLDDSYIRSACTSCYPVLDLYLSDDKRYLIQNGTGQIHFDNLEVRNIGESTSNSAVVKIYFSTNATLGNTDKELKNITIPTRNVNSSYGIDAKINGWDFYNNNDLATGNYYLLIQIDATNTNNEGSEGESNNFLALPFRYEDTTGKSPILLNQSFEENTRYSVDIYGIDGIKVQSKEVNSKNEEVLFINQLPKGFFIVKNDKETYKVSN